LLAAAAVAVLVAAGGLAYWSGREPAPTAAAPAASSVAVPSAPAAVRDISGKWVTQALVNPYDPKQQSILQFEFEQSGEAVFGTVTEKGNFSAALKGIQEGQIKGDAILFYTQGLSATGSGEQPYKEHYRGTLKGSEIEFVRQNDVASGGLPQKFTAKRE
jgi:hypothetical protein